VPLLRKPGHKFLRLSMKIPLRTALHRGSWVSQLPTLRALAQSISVCDCSPGSSPANCLYQLEDYGAALLGIVRYRIGGYSTGITQLRCRSRIPMNVMEKACVQNPPIQILIRASTQPQLHRQLVSALPGRSTPSLIGVKFRTVPRLRARLASGRTARRLD